MHSDDYLQNVVLGVGPMRTPRPGEWGYPWPFNGDDSWCRHLP